MGGCLTFQLVISAQVRNVSLATMKPLERASLKSDRRSCRYGVGGRKGSQTDNRGKIVTDIHKKKCVC